MAQLVEHCLSDRHSCHPADRPACSGASRPRRPLTRRHYFEANLDKLKTPVKVVWGEKDLYIKQEMGRELAERVGANLSVLPDIGHYPHLQDLERTVEEVRASFR